MANKILIVDDDADLVETMRTILENDGYNVVSASDGSEGFDVALKEHPDVILLDVMMAEKDEGFKTAYKFRNEASLKNVPIIMITSVSKETGFHFDKEKDGDLLPVDDFVEKPIKPDQLLDLVRKNLGK